MLVERLKLASVARVYLRQALGYAVWCAFVVAFDTVAHVPERFGMAPGLSAKVVAAIGWHQVGIPFNAIAALGGALAIFLGFRNNTAYDRWWEARKIWGELINDSRSFCRQALSWLAPLGEDDGAATAARNLAAELIHRHLAFVHGLRHHLRGERSALLAALRSFTPAGEAERYETVPNVLTALLMTQGRRLTEVCRSGNLDPFRLLAMDAMLTRLSDIQGKCERIRNTPLPRQYDAFPRWFVYLYALLLPFGFVESLGWGAVPVSVSIGFIFATLEASGIAIENPFDGPMSIPMTALCTTIERDLRAALQEPVPAALVPDERGILM